MGKQKPKETAKIQESTRYIHVDEYLATRNDVSDIEKAGFRVYMKGQQYQKSIKDFDEHLKQYLGR